MLGANIVIDGANPVLCQAPESFEGVHVRLAFDVDARGMIDAAVLIAEMRQSAINARLISEDDATRHDAPPIAIIVKVVESFGGLFRIYRQKGFQVERLGIRGEAV